MFRKEVRQLFLLLRRRLAAGDGIKVGTIELDATRVGAGASPITAKLITESAGRFAEFQKDREEAYDHCRRVMLVHRIFRSCDPEQIFDIEVYCIPHKQGTLASVKSVSYCFGIYWKNVYTSSNRFNGFAVTTAAYGPTICAAEIEFSDDTRIKVSRYIDFEMGPFACITSQVES
jgi:hypothetical protein